MAGGDHGLYTRRCQVEDRWLSFRGRIEIFISILPEDLKVFRYTHEEKLTLPKFGIALKSLSAFDLADDPLAALGLPQTTSKGRARLRNLQRLMYLVGSKRGLANEGDCVSSQLEKCGGEHGSHRLDTVDGT